MQNSTADSAIGGNGSNSKNFIEKEIRCVKCGKLLTKLTMFVSFPEDWAYDFSFSLSEILPELEIKVGLETKCNRCKELTHKITVV